jgi:hypothetical protein
LQFTVSMVMSFSYPLTKQTYLDPFAYSEFMNDCI